MAPSTNEEIPGEPPVDENKSRRIEQLLPDVLKRAFYAGLGAVFSTEEGIRKMASDVHLPKDVAKDVAAFLMQQANNTKDEFVRIVAREVGAFLQTVNLSNELQKLLTSLSFEIKTEIRFIPNEDSIGGVKPDIKKQVTVRRADKADKSEEAEVKAEVKDEVKKDEVKGEGVVAGDSEGDKL